MSVADHDGVKIVSSSGKRCAGHSIIKVNDLKIKLAMIIRLVNDQSEEERFLWDFLLSLMTVNSARCVSMWLSIRVEKFII